MTTIAKSDGYLLSRHGLDAMAAADHLFAPDGFGSALARMFGVEPATLHAYAVVASALHDVGKACQSFQDWATGAIPRQHVRHEHLSALMLVRDDFRSWLNGAGIDADVITAAVLGHHLKAAPPQRDDIYAWCSSPTGCGTRLLFDDPGVVSVLSAVGDFIGAPPPAIGESTWSPAGSEWDAVFDSGVVAARAFDRRCSTDLAYGNLVAALKIAVVVADTIASAVGRFDGAGEWINAVTPSRLSPEMIVDDVIAPRVADMAAYPNRMQVAARDLGDRAVVVAGCGSGKTLAAWEWAAGVARRRRIGSVVFLYPTRGTADEGFRDYVLDSGSSALVHSSSRYSLLEMRAGDDEADSARRLGALGLWGRRYLVGTVDQFLSVVTCRREAWCAAPVLADSAVVVDEAHAMDARMWCALESVVSRLDIPVLVMSATLQADRIDRMRALGADVLSDQSDSVRTYSIQRTDWLAASRNAVANGCRVLVVKNTVAAARDAFDSVSQAMPDIPVVLYHSRFRAVDRAVVHRRAIDVMTGDGPAVLVATQVAEMSLDIDADVLVTDYCPIGSFAQRLGRVVRRPGRVRPGRGLVVVVEPEYHLPYGEDEIDECRRLVRPGVMTDTEIAGLAARCRAGFLDGAPPLFAQGWYTRADRFRESDDSTRSAVLESDVADVLAALGAGQPFDGFVLPAPNRMATDHPGLPSWLGVVSAPYSPETGLDVRSRTTGRGRRRL